MPGVARTGAAGARCDTRARVRVAAREPTRRARTRSGTAAERRSGGGRGIRTHGWGSPNSGFQDRRTRPLCEPSKATNLSDSPAASAPPEGVGQSAAPVGGVRPARARSKPASCVPGRPAGGPPVRGGGPVPARRAEGARIPNVSHDLRAALRRHGPSQRGVGPDRSARVRQAARAASSLPASRADSSAPWYRSSASSVNSFSAGLTPTSVNSRSTTVRSAPQTSSRIRRR